MEKPKEREEGEKKGTRDRGESRRERCKQRAMEKPKDREIGEKTKLEREREKEKWN